MSNYYNKEAQEVLKQFDVTRHGLANDQVQVNQAKHGYNLLEEIKKQSFLMVFIKQFKDLLVLILLAAALISLVSGNVESTIVIFAVIIINAVLGTVQHFKAEQSLDSLKALSAPSAKVIRNGTTIQIPSKEVVQGDILVLEAGDLVVADGRIVENFSLQVNESSLTGESENASKTAELLVEADVAIADQSNMVFASSLVTYGRAIVVVTEIGMQTQIGKIATLMNQTKQKKTPLQISLDDFSKKLAFVILAICAVVFSLGVYRKMPVIDSLMFAVALAVAAIPEALSSIVTIVLSIGTQKMVKEHAIIKELKAVESLGAVSVICSDKTGTLTQNKMTVQKIYIDNKLHETLAYHKNNLVHRHLLNTAVLANDSTVVDGKPIGDPTEFALIEWAQKLHINEIEHRNHYQRISEIAFDSDRKLMSTLHQIDGRTVMYTKGALDVLLERSTAILTAQGEKPITAQDKQDILDTNQMLSENGLRVLAFAFREMQNQDAITVENERDYTFIGLVSMIDPPREGSVHAVEQAKRAGMKTVMITGDHKITASAIARQIGILENYDIAITGVELDQLTDDELQAKISDIAVYARVSPEHKIRIVSAWQDKGAIVAMTGDGVNDAPSLKKSDIGIAMGITGTDVSKDAASMILTDDNFATIVKAIANGRNVYQNIKNAIKFLLSGNTAGILTVVYTSLLALPLPFAPVQLLFINLLTDSLPAIAIGMEPSRDDVLSQKPRNPKEGILTKDFLLRILVEGGIIAICTILAFYLGLRESNALASTMAFSTLALARLFHGFNCRGKLSIFKLGLLSNKASVLAFLGGVALLSAVLFIPFLKHLFEVAPLMLNHVGLITLLAFFPTLLIQLYKLLREKRKQG